MADISQRAQEHSPGGLVILFELDTTPIGGTEVLRFTPNNIDGNAVVFQGVSYDFVDCEAEGFEWSGSGPLPQPTIRVNNVNLIFSALVRDYEDLVGAKLTRRRTYESFLDGGADAGAGEFEFPVDIYAVDTKTKHNKVLIEWRLSSAMDQQGRKLPGRQILRDTCTHLYRVWDEQAQDFDYSKATCPYVSANFFDVNGNAVASGADDICGKRLSDCKLRFGQTGVLPTRKFPGVGRARV